MRRQDLGARACGLVFEGYSLGNAWNWQRGSLESCWTRGGETWTKD